MFHGRRIILESNQEESKNFKDTWVVISRATL